MQKGGENFLEFQIPIVDDPECQKKFKFQIFFNFDHFCSVKLNSFLLFVSLMLPFEIGFFVVVDCLCVKHESH